jgi:hypothetical protein
VTYHLALDDAGGASPLVVPGGKQAAGRPVYGPWLRGLAVVAGAICLVRGVLGLAQVQGPFDTAAPLVFLALVAGLSIRMLHR